MFMFELGEMGWVEAILRMDVVHWGVAVGSIMTVVIGLGGGGVPEFGRVTVRSVVVISRGEFAQDVAQV